MSAVYSERRRAMIAGAIGILLLVGAISVGIKASFGAFDSGYELHGTFAAAGQGMLPGSDVKIRGVNVGEVTSIELVDNRALLTMRINNDVGIPANASAVIRPKTLFGEKFVDIDPGTKEATGPYLPEGGEIVDTLGGFELEQVLTDTYPVLEAIDPVELAIVIDEIANAGAGLGENINRSIVNGASVLELAASNDAEFRQFTSDLALLSEALEVLAPDLVAGARSLNQALPTISSNGDALALALVDASRLARDLSDLIENNKGFIDTANTDGSEVLQVLFDNRAQVQPLLEGLTNYLTVQAEAFRIEVGDGTLMAAIKGVLAIDGGGVQLPDLGIGAASEARAATTTTTTTVAGPVLDLDELGAILDVLGGGGGD